VRQGCGLSPELFNIYINKVTKEWKQTTQNGIHVTSGKKIQTILYADDEVIIAENEVQLQMPVSGLNRIAKKYDIKISSSKSKQWEFVVKTYKGSKYKLKVKL
jgi:hypothetical protein